MRLLQSIILALLALTAGYCLTVTIVSWAVPPGEVSIPILIIGVVATVLAGLYVKLAPPSTKEFNNNQPFTMLL